jgi:hypothetical protein
VSSRFTQVEHVRRSTHLQHTEALGAQVGGRAGGRPGGPVAGQAPVLPLVVEALQHGQQAAILHMPCQLDTVGTDRGYSSCNVASCGIVLPRLRARA